MDRLYEESLLYDFYGELLTKHQKQIFEEAVLNDYSLSEVAEEHGITRQGVRDSIKRAEAQLFDMEERLGLAKRFNEIKKGVEDIEACVDVINDYNLNHSLSMEINDAVAKIKTLCSFLKE